MSLKPPSLWIEKRGRQHRVYRRNTSGLGLPARSYLPFYERDAATKFISLASLLGMDVARRVLATEDPQDATALMQAALAEQGFAQADPRPAPAPLAPAGPPPLCVAPADPRLTGVTAAADPAR
jgi:hypothetical protein